MTQVMIIISYNAIKAVKSYVNKLMNITLLLQQEQHPSPAKITVVGGKNTPHFCKNHSVQKSFTGLSEKMKCDAKN